MPLMVIMPTALYLPLRGVSAPYVYLISWLCRVQALRLSDFRKFVLTDILGAPPEKATVIVASNLYPELHSP
jgi:hypothetical protein